MICLLLPIKFDVYHILHERECKNEQKERDRQERLERMSKGELAEIKSLEQAAADWDKAEKIRRFAKAVEQKVTEVTDEDKKTSLCGG